MPAAVKVENLGKCYRIGREVQQGRYRTLRESLVNAGAAMMSRLRNGPGGGRSEEFWALRDIDLEIQPGEVMGIIGRNGAGKSTLLKILSRITKPTTGHVELRGRVGSLLEVGTGFHPELTGRENIFLNGSILGMSRREIARRFDEIVAFSEVERFLDTPVKRYSSGMYVRLAFGVAAHLEPEILLVDEVLAVGDAGFQKKCMGKMQDVTREGRTVVFVSHNMGSMGSLCKRIFWLEEGRVKREGEAKAVIDEYMSEAAVVRKRFMDLSGIRNTGDGRNRLTISALEWITEIPPRHGEPLSFRVHYEAHAVVEDVAFGLGISTVDGTRFLTFDSDDQGSRHSLMPGQHGWVEMAIDELAVGPGVYSLDIGARSGARFCLAYLRGFALIEVVAGPMTPDFYACSPGAGVRKTPDCVWEIG